MMTMTAVQVWTYFLLAWLPVRTYGKPQDVHITCQVSKDCVLPCFFNPIGGEEISWFRHGSMIYSYPPGNNEHTAQFVGRSSISTQQLALGNASLILQHSGPQDKGRYMCRVMKGQKENESHVVVKVEAPIRLMNLQMTRLSGYEEVKCCTSDVYPAPQVSWSTDPRVPVEKLKYTTRKIPDKQGLYSIESKLKRLGNRTDLTYICTINSTSQMWTAFLTEKVLDKVTLTSTSYSSFSLSDMNSAEGQDLTIPCKIPGDLQNFTLTWAFTRAAKTSVICAYDSRVQLISNQWNGTAWLDSQRVGTGDASLRLVGLQSLEHTGIYTCNVSTFQRTHVEQMVVNITSLTSEDKRLQMHSAIQWWIPAIVIALLAIIAAAVTGIIKNRGCSRSQNTQKAKDAGVVKVPITESEDPSEGISLTAYPPKEHT